MGGQVKQWLHKDPASIPECRGWSQSCGEYLSYDEEYCEYCDKERRIDEAADALREAMELQTGD